MKLPGARRLAWLGSAVLLACSGAQFTTASGDGGAPADASNEDTTTDASHAEAGLPDSIGPSDAPSTEGSVPTWCSKQGPSLLCSDFDLRALPVTQGFSSEQKFGSGGSFQIVSDNVSSPNGADGVANPVVAGTAGSGDRLVGDLWATSPPSSFTCTLAWKPVMVGTTAGDAAHILSIEITVMSAGPDAGDTKVQLAIYMTANGMLFFLEHYEPLSGMSVNHPLSASAVIGAWATAQIQITNGQQFLASLTPLGGGPSSQVMGALVMPLPPLSLGQLKVGPADFSMTSTTGGWDFHYDNVICTSP